MNSFDWYTAKTLEMLRHLSIVCLTNMLVRCLTNSKLEFFGNSLIVIKDAEIAIKIISLGNLRGNDLCLFHWSKSVCIR